LQRSGAFVNVIIYHNPKCSTSRNTLGMIRDAGIEPQVIEYLQTPPDRSTLVKLLHDAKLTPRELMRAKEARYAELKLDDAQWSDDQLIDFMVANPILINRPIVVTAKGTRLCRPAELVQELL
jgi:arsenate reductase (glutaredoxin)